MVEIKRPIRVQDVVLIALFVAGIIFVLII